MMKLTYGHGWLLTLLAATLLAACSDDTPDTSAEAQEIRFRADVWHVMEGTRATTYNNATDMQTEGSFACTTYYANTTTPYFTDAVANWNTTDEIWEFASRRTWPRNNQALDFFAYMPATLPSYLTIDPTPYNSVDNPDGYSSGSPRVSCINLPVSITAGSGDTTQELVLAYAADQNEEGTNTSTQSTPGMVALNFVHPFARIYFKRSDSNRSDVVINSVKIKDVKNNGICSFNGTTVSWTPSGDDTEFLVSGTPASGSTPATPATGNTPYLVLPQTFSENLTFTVNASWIDWGEMIGHNVSAEVNVGEWRAGYSYTYTFTISNTTDLIVKTDKFTEQW